MEEVAPPVCARYIISKKFGLPAMNNELSEQLGKLFMRFQFQGHQILLLNSSPQILQTVPEL